MTEGTTYNGKYTKPGNCVVRFLLLEIESQNLNFRQAPGTQRIDCTVR